MCSHCNIKQCSILNKSECPVNKLWELDRIDKANKAEAIRQAEAIINAS